MLTKETNKNAIRNFILKIILQMNPWPKKLTIEIIE
jgi:hypothetical protein